MIELSSKYPAACGGVLYRFCVIAWKQLLAVEKKYLSVKNYSPCFFVYLLSLKTFPDYSVRLDKGAC